MSQWVSVPWTNIQWVNVQWINVQLPNGPMAQYLVNTIDHFSICLKNFTFPYCARITLRRIKEYFSKLIFCWENSMFLLNPGECDNRELIRSTYDSPRKVSFLLQAWDRVNNGGFKIQPLLCLWKVSHFTICHAHDVAFLRQVHIEEGREWGQSKNGFLGTLRNMTMRKF